MWALDNRTAYAAERSWTRDRHGVHHWLVAVQASFDVALDGRLRLADEQPPPPLEPEHRGDPATTSLRRESELLMAKPGTDVLVEAHAHAPGGRPARSVDVALRVADVLEKRLVVHGTRVYTRGLAGLTPSSPLPFTRAPIEYEWAYGGTDLSDPDPSRRRIDPRNPVGKGVASDPARLVDRPAHAVEYPDGDPARRGPAGFGPISCSWSPRRELAGTYDERWSATRRPLLPADYDERHALAAPVDQRLPAPLRGGERIELLHLTPEGALRLELPTIRLALVTRFAGRRTPEEHGAALATVHVFAEERRLVLVWQGALRVAAPLADLLDATTVREVPSA